MSEQLSYKIFQPEGTPNACVVVVHGMQEHQKRYVAFGEYLLKNKIACITYDLPGHGDQCATEDLGYFGEKNGWFHLVESLVQMVKLAHDTFPLVPIIVFGHSMGTMVSRTFLQDYDDLIDGMILSGAPNYISASKMGIALAKIILGVKGKKNHSKLLENLATGSFNKQVQNPRTKLDWLSYHNGNVDDYLKDPLCGVPFTNQGYCDLFEGMGYMHDANRFHVTKPDLPIWFFAGEDDPCPGGEKGYLDSIHSLKNVGYHNVTSSLYPKMRHETLHEENSEQVMQDVVKWIEQVTKNGSECEI